MKKNKKVKRPSLRDVLKSLTLVLISYGIGFALIYWPAFFITGGNQYPECIANDIFPVDGNSDPRQIDYFLYGIHLPIAIVGFMLMAITTLRVTDRLNKVNILRSAVIAPFVLFVLFVLFKFAHFSFSKGMPVCVGYPYDQFMDLKLFSATETASILAFIILCFSVLYFGLMYLKNHSNQDKRFAILTLLTLVLFSVLAFGREHLANLLS